MPANIIKIDNATLKRYKYNTAKRKVRIISCRILIVCEGKKTEPYYFEAFKKQNRGTFVYSIEIEGRGENTIQVVDRAIELRDKAKGIEQEYDRVWAVFDRDSFSEQRFNGAIKKAEEHGISTAWSNEAFELWYLYHFQNRITCMRRDDYKKAISDSVNESSKYKLRTKYVYEKNCPNNHDIMNKYGSQDLAIKWAEAKSKEFTSEPFAKRNPCTMVFKLVLQLMGKDDDLNKELKDRI